jgi:hypothetical protein
MGAPKMLIKNVERMESSVAVVNRTYPLARIVVEMLIISVAYTILCPAEMVDVFCDGEVSMFWEFEDEFVEELPVCGAFAGLPVDYKGGETGEG